MVLQCLYSQCQAAQFGSALHYALFECAHFGGGDSKTVPHLVRRHAVRKRASQYSGYYSGSLSAYMSSAPPGHGIAYASSSAMHSIAHRAASASLSVRARETLTVLYSYTPLEAQTLTLSNHASVTSAPHGRVSEDLRIPLTASTIY